MSEEAMLESFLTEFNTIFPKRKIIFLTISGSHFFNLHNEKSDKDYRGIYLPSPEEVYLGKDSGFFQRKTKEGNACGIKNSSEDVDLELVSYPLFLDYLAKGDFNSMEMLHAPADKVLITSKLYQELVESRQSLLIDDISAFLGFIKKEYRRYGINIHHYGEQEEFIRFLKKYLPKRPKISDIFEELKEYAAEKKFISFSETKIHNGINTKVLRAIKIAQRMFQETVSVDYVLDELTATLNKYGHRQKNMASSGVEFKGLYHALRLIYEANDLLTYGEFRLPFDSARHATLKNIKEGLLPEKDIFNLVDVGITELLKKEKKSTNKELVKLIIENIKFNFTGKIKISFLLGQSYEN